MPYGLYVAAEGAQAQSQRLETIAHNLANVDTVGFKRGTPTFQSRFAEAIQRGQDVPGSQSKSDIGGGVKIVDVASDFSAGSLRFTKIPTDFAINGDGFFQVRSKDGNDYLTRAGNFLLDARGRLTTQDGSAVLDQSGSEIQIDGTRPWDVQAGGRIVQDGSSYTIGLARPQSLGDLAKVGNNNFRALAPTIPVTAEDRDVRQGYLEMSGVNPTQETMSMIAASRAFEANMKLIQHHDSMVGGLISRVLGNG